MGSLVGNQEFREIIGNKIKKLRTIKGITQVELGKELGFTSSGAISQVESGMKGLKLSSIIKAAIFFGLHPAVLISPVEMVDAKDFELLSKVIYLIEKKHQEPNIPQPLLRAIHGLLEDMPSPYKASFGKTDKRTKPQH